MTLYKTLLVASCLLLTPFHAHAKKEKRGSIHIETKLIHNKFCGKGMQGIKNTVRAKRGELCKMPAVAAWANKHCMTAPGYKKSKCYKRYAYLVDHPIFEDLMMNSSGNEKNVKDITALKTRGDLKWISNASMKTLERVKQIHKKNKRKTLQQRKALALADLEDYHTLKVLPNKTLE